MSLNFDLIWFNLDREFIQFELPQKLNNSIQIQKIDKKKNIKIIFKILINETTYTYTGLNSLYKASDSAHYRYVIGFTVNARK